ncbi:MAG: hypothetical protein IJS82_06050 [Paludibacteraceae bacterium]|nr:hypothetical protein [Paludibacteraceae bacterium]
MKKATQIIAFMLVVLAFVACERNEPGQKMIVSTLDLTVCQPDWKFDNITRQYYYRFDVPEIDNYAYNYGLINLYREFDFTSSNPYQQILPYSWFLTDFVEDPITGDTIVDYYTQHVDYLYGIGFLDVQLTNSDYIYPKQNPDTMRFRLQILK